MARSKSVAAARINQEPITMNPDNWPHIKQIFNSALELLPEDRDRYIADACNGDEHIRRQVENLLSSYDTDFLERAGEVEGGGRTRLAPGGVIGRYEILDLLGVGGMGEVYLA